jgi:hypothetical protein
LEDIYDSDVNKGTPKDTREQSRQQFEGSLNSYYAKNNAIAVRLTRFVYSLSAAVACEKLSLDETEAVLEFPVDPPAVLTRARVCLTSLAKGSFGVPAAYFYALGANVPPQITPAQRFKMACGDTSEHVLTVLRSAVSDGVVTESATFSDGSAGINPVQATRRLAALNSLPALAAPAYQMRPALQTLVNHWLSFPTTADWPDYVTDEKPKNFWAAEAAASPAAFLDLVLCALTQGFITPAGANPPNTRLGDLITQWLPGTQPANPPATVGVLSQATDEQWTAFFQQHPDWLPPFTQPGNMSARIAAFIRHVKKFFEVTPQTPPNTFKAGAEGVPTLDLPSTEWLGACITKYQQPPLNGGAVVFGNGFDENIMQQAAASVFQDDPNAQAWAVSTLKVIDRLYFLAQAAPVGASADPAGLRFSIMEALYARGFTGPEDLNGMTEEDFQQALIGTVAYPYAAAIYAKANPPKPSGQEDETFAPVNPDGSLKNCIPPPCLSPLGPVAYLHELLQLTEQSTCEKPLPEDGEAFTLGKALAEGRGPLATLLASNANLLTPLPKIDLVNECLEFMASTVPAALCGTVYNTASDQLAGHKLCKERHEHEPGCHDPARLFATLPEHSSPAVPVAQPAAYQYLKNDFSSCRLPYSQPLDLARSYLGYLRTSRYEVLRTFRKDITEFVLDPTHEPPGFQAHLWRYPVRRELACEYLGITPEECSVLYTNDFSPTPGEQDVPLWQLYGFKQGGENWLEIVAKPKEFLARTCLTYCELVEIQKTGFVDLIVFIPEQQGLQLDWLPDCEPCCLERYTIEFTSPEDAFEALKRLAVFIRLWRTLQHVHGARYSFQELADICSVLHLFRPSGTINPDFIRQLAAFQMLRDDLGIPLADPRHAPAGTSPAERIPLLRLWTAGADPAAVGHVIQELLEHIAHRAQGRRGHRPHAPEFIKLLAENLDPLSRLAGFDPDTPENTWQALPTHTLRFAEVLVKVCASGWGVGEILYLFTDEHLDGEDPFPLEEANEALDLPLDLPDDAHDHSLWALRRKLLDVQVSEAEMGEWTWTRIEASLRDEFGYQPEPGTPDYLGSLGTHFFPGVVEACGNPVALKERQYRVQFPGSSPALWNVPADGPFHYEKDTGELWTQLPLRDGAVIEKLSQSRPLSAEEQRAAQNLYFLPRLDVAPFAFLFPNFADADHHLIQEPDEAKRWAYFRRHFVLTRARCAVIAEHLAEHVAHATGQPKSDGMARAWRLLRHLFADENRPADGAEWEDDSGSVPPVPWGLKQGGGAFAALLGLTGTGLLAEFTVKNDQGPKTAWREVQGPLNAFGHDRDRAVCPVPMVIPALDFSLKPEHLQFAVLRNGFAIKDRDGSLLGGAQDFRVRWSGTLLVELDGTYTFRAGAPTAGNEEPNFEAAEQRHWRVTLRRGQKTWVVLHHRWPEEQAQAHPELQLRRGAYHLTVDFHQPQPDYARAEETVPKHTGFVLKYRGPDTEGLLKALPLTQLFYEAKDHSLAGGIPALSEHRAGNFLHLLYSSTLRDIRRTYQRAFKALLFAERFGLSARPVADDGQSELDYLLTHPDRFAGISYYVPKGNSAYQRHAAYFDFNLLPLKDNYHAPLAADDLRSAPSAKRMTALFDWWERLFDYTRMRAEARPPRHDAAWLLFHGAAAMQPDDCTPLLRHLGIDFQHGPLVFHYLDVQGPAVFPITYPDLEDDRWAVRVWHAEGWIRRLLHTFCPKDIGEARPALWAADDPSTAVPGQDEFGRPYPIGNANLTCFVDDGSFEHGDPRRYEAVQRLNDGLRGRARDALVAYLCALDRVPLVKPCVGFAKSAGDLSDRLLLEVEAGVCERTSRIEEAISACQNFISRSRLGLEPGWAVSHRFALLWDRCFASLAVWQAYKRHTLYKENWIDWAELEKARHIEAFRFLEAELRRSALTVPIPGGLEWWPDQLPPGHPGLLFLQKRDPSKLQRLRSPSSSVSLSAASYEGFDLLGTPERDARPSWLAPLGEGATPAPTPMPLGIWPGPTPVIVDGQSAKTPEFPFWIEAAVRLGTRFVRVAAAGLAPASNDLSPHKPKDTCCIECGKVHATNVDEYYFWLIDSRQFVEPGPPNVVKPGTPGMVALKTSANKSQRQGGSQTGTPLDEEFGFQDAYYDASLQDASGWHDPDELPKLLAWEPEPQVRLAWCRVHNGEFQQLRRSEEGVAVDPALEPELTFLGRKADSLVFSVSGAIRPDGHADPSSPGFRYDLTTDVVVVLPLVAQPDPKLAPKFMGDLPAYPYFVYHAPGAGLFPRSLYSPAVAVAWWLRAHCRFEPALKWYELVFNPLSRDCAWMRCSIDQPHDLLQPACCDSANPSDKKARDRSILLHYLETHLQWGEALLRRHCPEAFEQARLHFDTVARLLGERPVSVLVPEPQDLQMVSGFVPYFAPLNSRLLDLYERVADRRAMVHACLNAYRLRNGRPNRDMPYFCSDSLCRCSRAGESVCVEEEEWCHLDSPYRFAVRIEKAKELAGRLCQLGATLLSAFEKGDAEALASLHTLHEHELHALTIAARQVQWREADWQIQALQRTKQVTQANLLYYKNTLLGQGIPPLAINGDEARYQDLTNTSIVTRAAGNTIRAVGEAMKLIPDLFVGFPCEETWIPIGTKLAGVFESTGQIIDTVADVEGATAGLSLTEAGWERRLEEWNHQVQVLTIEVEQIELQILAAQRRRDQALRELNVLERQQKQSAEVLDFLRDKFTAHDLYLYLQKETSALYAGMYELAMSAARQAENAFNLERGYTKRRFLPEDGWDRLHEGLLAGERLELALQRMDKAYRDENVREYELTKHISLRLHFPMAYLRLQTTGRCEIEIPEWMLDLDYPGHYLRRIKSVSLTLPCVAGPYTGVHCRLTLLSSATRVDPRLTPPPHTCCRWARRDGICHDSYEACAHDPRVYRCYAACEAIATSSGQNDSGLFELNFRDERYLPFEFQGAVSRWRIELPPENNAFDPDTLSDLILHLNYTAREGGELLRRAANEAAQSRLPGDGWAFFDIRREFPDAWELFQHGPKGEPRRKELRIGLGRNLFPYVPGHRELRITGLELFFEAPASNPHGCHTLEFMKGDEEESFREEEREGEITTICCMESAEWPGLYHGAHRVRIEALGTHTRNHRLAFRFPASVEHVTRVFLFCRYAAIALGNLGTSEAPPKPWASEHDGVRRWRTESS